MQKTTVYIAGPYTHGDVAVNVNNAIQAADKIARAGMYPYIPHLSHFWHLLAPHEYEFWMKQDEVWLSKCDALLRLPGFSQGADREKIIAEKRGMKIFYSLDSLLCFYGGGE